MALTRDTDLQAAQNGVIAVQNDRRPTMKPAFWLTVFRSCRLRCPRCGQGRVAESWRKTRERCDVCELDFRVEGGFYLGSIYFNYGLMALITLGIGMPLVGLRVLTPLQASVAGVAFCVIMSVWFWRYARSLWLGFGYYIDHNVRGKMEKEARDRPTYLVAGEDVHTCACAFCHARFDFSDSHSGSWVPCPECSQQVLLTPAAPSAKPPSQELSPDTR